MFRADVIYPYEYKDQPVHFAESQLGKGFLEGYANALQDIMKGLTGDNSCGKLYDPMTVSDGVMHSYAFNMKDGGRHRPLTDYSCIGDICNTLLEEAKDWILYD